MIYFFVQYFILRKTFGGGDEEMKFSIRDHMCHKVMQQIVKPVSNSWISSKF